MYKLRQSHFKLGDDINNYMTTSMLQNKTMQESPKVISILDQAAKNDLRKSHFNLGNSVPNFETTFNSEYYDKSKSLPKNDKNFENMGKMLRSHNYEFGDDKPDYISEHKYRFANPKINPEERKQNRISNQLLQNYCKKQIIILEIIKTHGIQQMKLLLLLNIFPKKKKKI